MAHKHLYLLRHARTQEKLSGQTDFDRELDAVGLQNATRMGINLHNKDITFDFCISSPAVRAKTTAELIAEQLKYDTENIHYNEVIYEASVRNLLTVVNHLKDEWKHVLFVGHNPAISYFAEYITGQPIGNITTCGLVHVKFEHMKWEEVSEGIGQFISYDYPDLLNF